MTVLDVLGVRTAVPAVGTAGSARATASLARSTPAETGEGAGDGLSGVVLGRAHEPILHAT